MIKLNNLQKYFNKNKKNEIHVLNDINLELPSKGLVVLLGPSGSGKTTLLNVLGGLDKVQQGDITFGDEVISKYKTKVWDEIRNKHVGYIFQNYNLLTNLTVYDNISFTLNMIGVVDKGEIDKRIDYLLEHMGMGNYRKRRASQLSGGQQQRVAIARALAKNPKVIIADEPTGNLDSKNTIDIMNIIKQISKEKLVVLVTHEKELANFYADRIIELKDGVVINDSLNSSNGDLDLKHDTDIYLKDLNEFSSLSDDSVKVRSFSDSKIQEEINIKLILKDNKLYLDIDTLKIDKIQLLDSDSEVNIYDKHFEKVTKESFNDSDFDYESIIDESLTVSKHSVISIKETFKLALSKVSETTKAGKLLYVGFAGAAMLIAIASGLIFGIFHIEDNEFLTADKDIIIFPYDNQQYSELVSYEANQYVDYVNFVASKVSITVKLPTVYTSNFNYYGEFNNGTSEIIEARPELSSELKQSDLIFGTLPINKNDIVLDKAIFSEILGSWFSGSYNDLGIDEIEDFINLKYYKDSYELNITGISDTGFKGIYMDELLMYSLVTDIGVYEYFENDITLSSGSLPNDFDEVIINSELNIPYGTFNFVENGKTYTATGAFTYKENVDGPDSLMYLDDLKQFIYDLNYDVRGTNIYVNTNDVDNALKYFKSLDLDAESLYDSEKTEYFNEIMLTSTGVIVFALIVLSASSLSYYFIIRSSLISRIYEISVYRALGVSKMDIRKIFVTEIVLKTTISSAVGFLATSWFLMRIQSMADDYYEFIYFNFWNVVLGLIVIYGINIISGLIPVTSLLRKTPAEILSKYDL